MPIYHKPIINQWYRHLDKGYQFQVTAFDDSENTVEIQHFDGDIEELELRDWYELDIEPIETPEDWTGPVDAVRRDELGYSDMTPEDWEGPLHEQYAREEEPAERRERAREDQDQ